MNRAQESLQVTKQPYIEDVGPRKIKSIKFSLFSESEILKLAEVEVYLGLYYESTKKPIQNGLLDPRMEVLDFRDLQTRVDVVKHVMVTLENVQVIMGTWFLLYQFIMLDI